MKNLPLIARMLPVFAARRGIDIIGLRVLTEAIGTYPGGVARIIEVAPDPAAPEIAVQVRHETEIDPETGKLWEIGIFDCEMLILNPTVEPTASVPSVP